ncbi:MAG: ribosome small subunit-dependent GTPase A [Planctomycetes bacterium]|nr:ribosome small subunit-dependent GTPase A [Planctomycetota bacterium]
MSVLGELGFGPFFARQVDRDDAVLARIAAVHRERLEVFTATGPASARLAGRLLRDLDEAALPAVGDWVLLRGAPPAGEIAIIETILDRRSSLERGAAGRATRNQVVAANVDLVFVVSGLDGDYNPRRLERYLARIWASGATPVVLLNKVDLCAEPDERLAEVESICVGVEVIALSALEGQGVERVAERIRGGLTAAFVGSSGVGKSTLLNALLGEELMPTRAVREGDDRGCHTTTHRQLVRLPGGGLVIDTPGMRELQLADEEGLEVVFADVQDLASGCRFTDCEHRSEPDCAVQAAIADGRLAVERFEHYLKLLAEARAFERRHDARLQREYERDTARIHREIARAHRRKYGD